MLSWSRRLPAIHRLNLQQIRAFGLSIKHSLRVDEAQLRVDAEILVVPTAVLQQRVGNLRRKVGKQTLGLKKQHAFLPVCCQRLHTKVSS